MKSGLGVASPSLHLSSEDIVSLSACTALMIVSDTPERCAPNLHVRASGLILSLRAGGL